jgi:hypothetical protein
MNPEALIEQFCAGVNSGLERSEDCSPQVYDQLKAEVGEDEELVELLDDLRGQFRGAFEPTEFTNRRILKPGLDFDRCYALLRQSLGVDVVDPKEAFAGALSRDPFAPDDPAYALVARFWKTPGLQQYSKDGQLVRFNHDPLTVMESIVAVCSGDYMNIKNRPGSGMGAVGQAAARQAKRGAGHGWSVAAFFEEEMARLAAERGERLTLMILEAEPGARKFWARQGYRWPRGTQYMQPPLEYDETGEPAFPAVPELLMVKVMGQPEATHIDRELLVDALRTLYHNWYIIIARDLPEAARKRVDELVFGKLFTDFMNTLPTDGTKVELVQPPIPG